MLQHVLHYPLVICTYSRIDCARISQSTDGKASLNSWNPTPLLANMWQSLRHKNESEKFFSCVQQTFHIATIYTISSFSHSDSVFAVVSGRDWGLRTVLSRSNLGSMEWGTRSQKNGHVANSCLGEQTKLHSLPVCNVQSEMSFTSWAIICYTNTSPLPMIKLKSGLMAGDSISKYIKSKRNRELGDFHHRWQYQLRPFVFFSLCHL